MVAPLSIQAHLPIRIRSGIRGPSGRCNLRIPIGMHCGTCSCGTISVAVVAAIPMAGGGVGTVARGSRNPKTLVVAIVIVAAIINGGQWDSGR